VICKTIHVESDGKGIRERKIYSNPVLLAMSICVWLKDSRSTGLVTLRDQSHRSEVQQ